MSAVVPGRYWSRLDDGRVLCELCPRLCRLKEGQRGFCFVRENIAGEVMLRFSSKTNVAVARCRATAE